MANRTVKGAHTIKGTNPQYLVEKIIRERVYEAKYWKEECFGLSADLIVDKGAELQFVGGTYAGNVKPTPFICLLLKMLQIQPDKDIIVEFIRQEDFKYLRALGAVYMRLTGESVETYKYLEPLYNDYRKLRAMNKTGEFYLLHMDEFIDQLLTEDRSCDVQLPRLQKRDVLEESGKLEPYVSILEEDVDDMTSSDEEEKKGKGSARHRSPSPKRRSPYRRRSPVRRRSRSRERRDRRSRSRSRDRDHRRDKGKDRGNKEDKKEDDSEREIREANELRAKLGLKPLEK